MSGSTRALFTIDEIEPDEEGTMIATLVTDDGLMATVPLNLLPSGARVNQAIIATFELDPATTEDRTRRVRDLQHRLFNREREP